jgi:hypothetical protein
MIILHHIQLGLNTASESFLTVWEHKKVLLYLLIPVALNFIFPIYSAYDFIYTLISRGAPTDFVIVIKAMAKAIIADLGIACIAVHAYLLYEHQTSSVRATLSTVAKRAPIIASWSIIAGTIIYLTLSLLYMIAEPLECGSWMMHCIYAAQIFLGLLWILGVFFVIPILALEEFSLLESIKLSCTLARALIFEIIGGELWIGLICLLSMLPLMILFEKPMAYYLFENEAIHDWSGIAPSILILIGWVCATAQTIFRTRLLYLAYLQPREQETDVLFYPRF